MENLLVISSDSHVFEPPDLWTERIDAEFRDRAPRMQRVGDADHLVVEKDQMIAGIGLISNAGARFENPEQISAHGRFEDVHAGGYDPDQHIRDMKIDGVSGELLYPSQGLFYFKVADSPADVGNLPRLQRLAGGVLLLQPRPAQGRGDGQPR